MQLLSTRGLTDDLRQQYQGLFNTCVVTPSRVSPVDSIIKRIMPNQSRYLAVGNPLGIPWYFVAVIHNMEASLNFTTHLHNGDPLTARTVNVPAGRPGNGQPPFTWEASAMDALTYKGLPSNKDWSLAAILYLLEGYNGYGYRNRTPPVNTPYLWSYSSHYTSGKFKADHVFDPNAVSGQCGAAVLLFRMAQGGAVTFASAPAPTPAPAPVAPMTAAQLAAQFDNTVTFSDSENSDQALALQRALNAFPGVHVGTDGIPGTGTSNAYLKITGHFLQGDPRR